MRQASFRKQLLTVVYWLSFSYVILFTTSWPSLRVAAAVQTGGRPLNSLQTRYALAAIVLQVFFLSFGYLILIATRFRASRGLLSHLAVALMIPLLFFSLETPFVLAIASRLGIYAGMVTWSLGDVLRALIPLMLLLLSLWVAFFWDGGIKNLLEEKKKRDAQ